MTIEARENQEADFVRSHATERRRPSRSNRGYDEPNELYSAAFARISAGVTWNWRANARRIRCSSPKPKRLAMEANGTSLFSTASRAAATRIVSTSLEGVMPVWLARLRENVRR